MKRTDCPLVYQNESTLVCVVSEKRDLSARNLSMPISMLRLNSLSHELSFVQHLGSQPVQVSIVHNERTRSGEW
jgi:hypothetical protein